MRKILRKILTDDLLDAARYWHSRVFRGGRFALNDLDRKIEKHIGLYGGYFIELGANNGFSQSNTLYFELKKRWRGVLIEPVPHLYLQCLRRRSRPGNSIICAACVPFEFDEKFVEIEYAGLMSLSKSLELDIDAPEEFLERGRAHLNNKSEGFRFGAPAMTLTQILDENQSPKKIDLLSLDVEGAEISVLNGIDFERYDIEHILVETRNFQAIEKFLLANDYTFIDALSKHDYLFKLNSSH